MADEQTSINLDDITNSLHSIFLAGVGAIASSSEKGSELFKALVDKGRATVDEGKAKSAELVQNAQDKVSGTTHDAIRSYLSKLSPDQRAAFVESVQKAAAEAEDDVRKAAEKTAEAARHTAQDVADEAAKLDAEGSPSEDEA